MGSLGFLFAWEPPLEPVEITALAILALVVRHFLKRDDTDETHTLERIAALESKVEFLEKAMSAERTAKHEAMATAASLRGTLQVVQFIGAECTCGTFPRLAPLMVEALRRDGGG